MRVMWSVEIEERDMQMRPEQQMRPELQMPQYPCLSSPMQWVPFPPYTPPYVGTYLYAQHMMQPHSPPAQMGLPGGPPLAELAPLVRPAKAEEEAKKQNSRRNKKIRVLLGIVLRRPTTGKNS
ncbi:hypothetical protein JTB14_004570 [Gonioctena quinquepunctata]|nr:hypothetical protein JTB14_004570 [Gonioctena quinquepunctata]